MTDIEVVFEALAYVEARNPAPTLSTYDSVIRQLKYLLAYLQVVGPSRLHPEGALDLDGAELVGHAGRELALGQVGSALGPLGLG